MGCSCLFALLAAFAPRIALFFVWIFTPYVSRAYSTWILPLLGFFFLPFTTLIYALLWTPAVGPGYGVTGWEWLWVILAVILDIGSYGGGAYGRSKKE